VLLKHHAGAPPMHSHGATAAQDADSGDDDATGGRLEKSIERTQEGRLAGAGGTEKER